MCKDLVLEIGDLAFEVPALLGQQPLQQLLLLDALLLDVLLGLEAQPFGELRTLGRLVLGRAQLRILDAQVGHVPQPRLAVHDLIVEHPEPLLECHDLVLVRDHHEALPSWRVEPTAVKRRGSQRGRGTGAERERGHGQRQLRCGVEPHLLARLKARAAQLRLERVGLALEPLALGEALCLRALVAPVAEHNGHLGCTQLVAHLAQPARRGEREARSARWRPEGRGSVRAFRQPPKSAARGPRARASGLWAAL